MRNRSDTGFCTVSSVVFWQVRAGLWWACFSLHVQASTFGANSDPDDDLVMMSLRRLFFYRPLVYPGLFHGLQIHRWLPSSQWHGLYWPGLMVSLGCAREISVMHFPSDNQQSSVQMCGVCSRKNPFLHRHWIWMSIVCTPHPTGLDGRL